MAIYTFYRRSFVSAILAVSVVAAFACGARGAISLELTADGYGPGQGKVIAVTSADIGTPITLDIWATVSGANGTSSDEGLQTVELNFRSIGAILGNLTNLSHDSDFSDVGTQNGAAYGMPGDFDLGSTDTSNVAGWWVARTQSVRSGTGPASNGAGAFRLGSITFTPSDLGAATATSLQLNVRDTALGALWFEDATVFDAGGGLSVWTNDKNPTSGVLTIGAPVIVVPEPATMGLLAVAGAVMLRRRKRV